MNDKQTEATAALAKAIRAGSLVKCSPREVSITVDVGGLQMTGRGVPLEGLLLALALARSSDG